MENFDLVQRAYDELVKSGEIYATSDQLIVEGHKAYLTRRAAYYLNLNNPDFGLLSKTTGNNIMGLSTDIVMKHNGDFYDIATDSAGLVRPVNSGVVSDPSLANRWVQPTKELAGFINVPPVPVPIPIPTPIPIPIPSNDYQKILDILTIIQNNLTESLNMININQLMILDKLGAKIDAITNKPITFPDYKSSGWLSITLSPVKK